MIPNKMNTEEPMKIISMYMKTLYSSKKIIPHLRKLKLSKNYKNAVSFQKSIKNQIN